MNSQRRLVGGLGGGYVGDAVHAETTTGATPAYYRAVVVDVLYDPDGLTTEDKTRLKQSITNPEVVDVAPPNSIVARLITDGHDLTSPTPSIVFPFFSSHFQLPVQPGEQVTVVFDDFSRQGSTLGRWISRVHEFSQVEDVNYTHGDRRFDPSLFQVASRGTADSAQQSSNNQSTSGNPPAIGFQNGGGTQATFTLQPLSGSSAQNPYDKIVDESSAIKFSTQEPVPRWIKRPQELVLQGMNNTLIMLGEDRVGPALRVSGSSKTDNSGYAGTVDIVCGRGRGGIPYSESVEPESTNQKTGTSPLVATNTRRKLEVDKNPRRRSKARNRTEGNPNFRRDAARLYVSMNTQGDKNFRTQHSSNEQEGFLYPDNVIRPVQPAIAEGGIGLSYFIGKADHVRLIGRKETDPEIKGSVLLLREGTKDDDLAYVYLEEGKVQVEAKKIYLSQSTAEAEPYIKWTIYDKHITELKKEVLKLADQIKKITSQYNTAFRTGNPYSLAAGLATIGTAVEQDTSAVELQLRQSLLDQIPGDHREDAKSTVIFGK